MKHLFYLGAALFLACALIISTYIIEHDYTSVGDVFFMLVPGGGMIFLFSHYAVHCVRAARRRSSPNRRFTDPGRNCG